MNILLVQPDWPTPSKIKDPQKYFPYPLIKLGAYYRSLGHKVTLKIGNERSMIPFLPDKICITTVFSWWFPFVKECVEFYRFLYPNADIEIGGVHASLMPDIYERAFPYAKVYVGSVPEAESIEPAWDLLPVDFGTQIIKFSQGCLRRCSFCYCHLEDYETFGWDEIACKIRYRKLILNDNNFLMHPDARKILQKLADFKVDARSLSGVEIQGGFDVRILADNLDFIPLMKSARVKHIRLAWDGGLKMAGMVETCLEALEKEGFHKRDIRCYMLYNHDLPFETILEKLKYFERWQVGPIHSRFRPLNLLYDGYIPQKRSQGDDEYYIHKNGGWTDKKVRIIGSLASDISRMARADVDSLDEVRRYYGRPSVNETVRQIEA